MIYIRGNRYDYDTWRDEYGCAGWGYTDLLPYFLRAEDNSRGASAYHGAGGPLRVQDGHRPSPLTRAFVEAAAACGLPANDDFNGPAQDGVGFYQVTQRGGRRCSAADAYLRPALARPNLTVQTDSLVTRIAIEGGRAAAVHYLRGGAEETARAEAEVLLAGGAVNSPQLLMLSGIGPADQLRELGIDVVADSPGVGANLCDHPIVTAMWHTPEVRGLWEQAGPASLLRWQLAHTGPLVSNVAEAGGFSRSDPGLPAPDLQWHVLPVPYENQGLTDPARRALSVLVTLVSVRSRGAITLRSADPRHKPAIDPGYLTDSADIEPLVTGLQMARQFAAARPMARLCASELAPGPGVRTDAELRDFIRHDLATAVPPGRQLRHGRRAAAGRRQAGQRGRPGAAGARGGRAARGGRLGHAGRAARQHQRAGDRHRRARGRPHRRPFAAGRRPIPGRRPRSPPVLAAGKRNLRRGRYR